MIPSVNQVALVGDFKGLRRANSTSLRLAGLTVVEFETGEDATALNAEFPGVVVLDIDTNRNDGRQLFHELRVRDVDLPVIVISGHRVLSEAVEIMQCGAFDFVEKPFPAERLIFSVKNALEARHLVLERRSMRAFALAAESSWPMIGETAVMDGLRSTLRKLAEVQVDVLIEGETGVGKELAARAIHGWSQRRQREFLTVDCAALPATSLESELFGHELGAFNGAVRKRVGRLIQADHGTVFLDGVESLSLEAQGRFLRVLEEREVTPLGATTGRTLDVRFIASSQINLGDAVRQGRFREDLFHRLDVMRVRIPPLRERRQDIFLLFSYFAAQAADRFGRPAPRITDGVHQRLLNHDWPGNVRELAHFAERFAMDIDVDPASSGETFRPGLSKRVATYEAQLIVEALTSCHGDAGDAARMLGIPRKTFYDKLARHGIDIKTFR
jgi:two-component system C4-dicarboxylate transport response regulator DctD